MWKVKDKAGQVIGFRAWGADGELHFKKSATALKELLADIKLKVKLAVASDAERWDVVQAREKLPPDWTLLRCVEFVSNHLRRTKREMAVTDAVRAFIATKADSSPYHRDDWQRKLNRWIIGAGLTDRSCRVSSITEDEVKRHLSRYREGYADGTYRAQVAVLRAFFNWAVREGYTSESPVQAEKVRPRGDKPIVYLDPEQLAALLRRAHDRPDVTAWLVLGAFCGLRPYEAINAEWSGVHLDDAVPYLRIEGHWSKIKYARALHLNDTQQAWLRSLGPNEGTIIGASVGAWSARWRKWRKENEDVVPLVFYKESGLLLRHTAITYLLGSTRNAHLVAEECATSLRLLRTAYTGVVDSAKAARFWAIRP